MKYIVFDLEWNQCPEGREKKNPALPFEIIEIGAVRLTEDLKPDGEFSALVNPKVYHAMQYQVRRMVPYSMRDLRRRGKPFPEVCRAFLEFAGEDPAFVTWGPGDLSELQRNMAFYRIPNRFPKPFLYLDAQKLYSLQYQDGKKRLNLEAAVEELGLRKEEGRFHRAIADARYTADVFQTIDLARFGHYKSVDLYRIPDTRRDEYRLNFGTYEKYVTRGFAERESAMKNKDLQQTRCYICGRPLSKKIRWFVDNQGHAYGLFSCPEHGLIKGRFRVRQAPNGLYYGIRIMKQTDEIGAQKIRLRKDKDAERLRRRAEEAKQKNKNGADKPSDTEK
jgi:inhibitor of KinA sporulation pathway (predicted exonuclease)